MSEKYHNHPFEDVRLNTFVDGVRVEDNESSIDDRFPIESLIAAEREKTEEEKMMFVAIYDAYKELVQNLEIPPVELSIDNVHIIESSVFEAYLANDPQSAVKASDVGGLFERGRMYIPDG